MCGIKAADPEDPDSMALAFEAFVWHIKEAYRAFQLAVLKGYQISS